MSTGDPFRCAVSSEIWRSKYQYRDEHGTREGSVHDTWRRVAAAIAAAEPREHETWRRRFYALLRDFDFLPGGRILAGAGTDRSVTLFNCFVMGIIEDSMDGIFNALREGAITMQQGGGVGYDFSTLRPAGARAKASGTFASGPVSFMRIWDSMCATLLSTGARRGAMMATLRCDHPDIEQFVDAKRDVRELRHFNLSVLVSRELMAAVERDEPWPLVFPAAALGEPPANASEGLVQRRWSGTDAEVPCRIVRVVAARELWSRLMRAAYECAEPGVLFVDHINEGNPLWYRESISATNPCGEVPLPPYGACNLGSLNLTRFVSDPFSAGASLDLERLGACAATAVRFLDNVIDVSRYPFAAQREQALRTRRIGLGITGLGDALIMLGHHYDGEEGRKLAGEAMRTLCHSAYRTSIALAEEKSPFPDLRAEPHCEGAFVRSLPVDIVEGIARKGLRNSHLLAIAPTGTVSLLANNISSGVEPVFAARLTRRILGADGRYHECEIADLAWDLWRETQGHESPPEAFVTAPELAPMAHLAMQATLQRHVDQAISKTINVAESCDFESFRDIYRNAFDLGLKGCTTFRPNPVTGAILSATTPREAPIHCCSIERECD